MTGVCRNDMGMRLGFEATGSFWGVGYVIGVKLFAVPRVEKKLGG